ncbi:XRE family transcriptional regulator [Phycicoccus sp. M110.8]|uniref:helix-turn-helix domain-containing protein n=1 Tax=Phycicoccus sp. M110.8 TaxID=3075433 RepID=UPI0028FD8D38|nr:XRE family transcriptional regulator [Phycicoccus sp. M110.8]MDU0314088.1 XRE family transcriptional regulator [Phycicoccus sp. M110.8]
MTSNDSVDQVETLLGLTPRTDLAADVPQQVPERDSQVGRRVRLARRRAGLDGRQAAPLAGLTPDKLSKIESGKRRVSPRELPALARALGVSMPWLLGTADASRSALALAHRVAAGEGERATSAARTRAVAILEAEDRLSRNTDLPGRYLSPAGAAISQLVAQEYQRTPRTRAEAGRQGRSLAEDVRRRLELGVAEVGDLPALIEMHFAADVALSPLGPGSDGLCAHDGDAALLVVNTDFPWGRARFTLAHELGHHLLRDARDVIEESQSQMLDGTFVERRVNSFAAHFLLPIAAVSTTMAWLGVTADDVAGATERGRLAVGYLMVRYGVSLPCALGQLVDAGFLKVTRRAELADALHPGSLVRAAQRLIPGRPGPEQTLREQRPPARLATAALEAARRGTVGMNTVAAVLGREDDERLFDEVMFDQPAAACT